MFFFVDFDLVGSVFLFNCNVCQYMPRLQVVSSQRVYSEINWRDVLLKQGNSIKDRHMENKILITLSFRLLFINLLIKTCCMNVRIMDDKKRTDYVES